MFALLPVYYKLNQRLNKVEQSTRARRWRGLYGRRHRVNGDSLILRLLVEYVRLATVI